MASSPLPVRMASAKSAIALSASNRWTRSRTVTWPAIGAVVVAADAAGPAASRSDDVGEDRAGLDRLELRRRRRPGRPRRRRARRRAAWPPAAATPSTSRRR